MVSTQRAGAGGHSLGGPLPPVENRSPVTLPGHGPTHHPAPPASLRPSPVDPMQDLRSGRTGLHNHSWRSPAVQAGALPLCGHSEVIYGGRRQLSGKMKGLTVKESRSSEKQVSLGPVTLPMG